MNAEALLSKAETAAKSARLLLEAGDIDGACNRAYYAMFDAARGALLETEVAIAPEIARTHSGLLSAFSLHLVKTRRFPISYGRALNRQHEVRLIADYSGDLVEAAMAAAAVADAEDFVVAIRRHFFDKG